MTAELIQRLVLPMVQERSREPGDAWEQAHAAMNTMLATEASFKAREDALVKAASDLRDDLLMRAEFDSDAVAIVAAGNGVWWRFNQALDAARAHTAAEGGE